MMVASTMRHVLAILALLACAVPAQQRVLPALDGAAPLPHPRAPRALRGVSICVSVEPGTVDGSRALRAANYLTRLLEGAGAAVALVLDPDADVDQIARSCGAALRVSVAARDAARDDLDRALDGLGTAPRAGADPYLLSVNVGTNTLGSDPGIAMRAHRDTSHRVFAAIVRWCEPQLDALRERARAHQAQRPARGPDPLWPLDRAPATEAEVAVALDNWRRRTVVDRSQVFLQVEVRKTDDGWEMSGATELPLLEAAARRTLASIGVSPVTGGLRTLPDLGALAGSPFGIVRGPAVVSWRIPGRSTGHSGVDPQGQVEETELHSGEPVRLLDRADGFVLTHAVSGYLGWVPERVVQRCDAETFAARLHATTLGDGENTGLSGELAARTALARLGTPYVFGGRSENGIDCSGLVETSWAAQGVFLPRDASQQILAGALVATAAQPAPLEPGDLLFFANGSGRISHVAVSLGGHRFVHATPPEVTVGSLASDDPYYASVAERFVLAKRVAR